MTTAPAVRGLWLGLLGVCIFAITIPMTRIAAGTTEDPAMTAGFIAMGRAAVAGLLSLAFIRLTRAPRPQKADWPPLIVSALGVVFGFPLLLSWALRYVPAVHASVVLGVLPLITAMVGAWLHRQRPSPLFWLCAASGSALVMVYAVWQTPDGQATMTLDAADLALLIATLCAAVGYGFGARLSHHLRAEHVICWSLVISLPVTLPYTWWHWPQETLPLRCWLAFGYLSVFSMWLGFFAWYRGLALGGTVRVSQVQLAQPFIAMVFAVPLLGERLDVTSLAFATAVIVTVFMGRRAAVRSS
jgi:drug/metabolite transporter (DMT)-like permease